MSVHLSLIISDDLHREIQRAAEESDTNKAEILRKALQLFLSAREGTKSGLKLGLIEPESEKIKTEIIGL